MVESGRCSVVITYSYNIQYVGRIRRIQCSCTVIERIESSLSSRRHRFFFLFQIGHDAESKRQWKNIRGGGE